MSSIVNIIASLMVSANELPYHVFAGFWAAIVNSVASIFPQKSERLNLQMICYQFPSILWPCVKTMLLLTQGVLFYGIESSWSSPRKVILKLCAYDVWIFYTLCPATYFIFSLLKSFAYLFCSGTEDWKNNGNIWWGSTAERQTASRNTIQEVSEQWQHLLVQVHILCLLNILWSVDCSEIYTCMSLTKHSCSIAYSWLSACHL